MLVFFEFWFFIILEKNIYISINHKYNNGQYTLSKKHIVSKTLFSLYISSQGWNSYTYLLTSVNFFFFTKGACFPYPEKQHETTGIIEHLFSQTENSKFFLLIISASLRNGLYL